MEISFGRNTRLAYTIVILESIYDEFVCNNLDNDTAGAGGYHLPSSDPFCVDMTIIDMVINENYLFTNLKIGRTLKIFYPKNRTT